MIAAFLLLVLLLVAWGLAPDADMLSAFVELTSRAHDVAAASTKSQSPSFAPEAHGPLCGSCTM